MSLLVFCKDFDKPITKLLMFLNFRNSSFLGTHLRSYFREQREVNLIQSVGENSCSESLGNSKT